MYHLICCRNSIIFGILVLSLFSFLSPFDTVIFQLLWFSILFSILYFFRVHLEMELQLKPYFSTMNLLFSIKTVWNILAHTPKYIFFCTFTKCTYRATSHQAVLSKLKISKKILKTLRRLTHRYFINNMLYNNY